MKIIITLLLIIISCTVKAQSATTYYVNNKVATVNKRIDSLVLAFNSYKKLNDSAVAAKVALPTYAIGGDLIYKPGTNGAMDTLKTKYILVQYKDSTLHLNNF